MRLNFILLLLVFVNIYTPSSKVSANILDSLEGETRFVSPSNSNNISNPSINDITQDKNGFIWIGTNDGLNRFDGNESRIYRPLKHSDNSLSHHFVSSLLTDHQGNLWVGTREGLNQYIQKKDGFSLFRKKNARGQSLENIRVRTIFEDSSQRLWVSPISGEMNFISKSREQLVHVEISEHLTQSKKLYFHSFTEKEGKVLIGSSTGILFYNEKSKKLEPYWKKEKTKIFSNNILALANFEKILLLGTSRGFFKYIPESESLLPLFPKELSDKSIKHITPTGKDEFVIGTANSGIYFLNMKKEKLIHASASSKDSALRDNQITSLFYDHDKLLWIGTNLGVQFYNSSMKILGHRAVNFLHPTCLSGNTIYNILKTSQENIWIGAFGFGLNQIDLHNNKCTLHINGEESKSDGKLKHVISSYQDENLNIWFGTYGDGIFVYNNQEKTFSSFESIFNSEFDNIPDYAYDITGDKNGTVWIATQSKGLLEYNLQNKSLKSFFKTSNKAVESLPKNIQSLVYDSSETLWVASSYKGLWTLNTNNKRFTKFKGELSDNIKIPQSLSSINLDNQKNLWIGTEGEGAIRLSTNDLSAKQFSIENGLLSNTVLNAQQDSRNNIWLYTDKGLSRISSGTFKIKTFLINDGLQANSFTNTGFFDKVSNQIYTGGINGFNVFNPSKVDISKQPKKTLMTNFQLFYKNVKISTQKSITPLYENIVSLRSIDLKHDQNVFAFSFTVPEYIYPERVKYAFKLNGYDQDWNYVDSNRRFANYTNIDPGNYVFQVKASNTDGEWSDNITSIKVNVAYPWWQTKIAYFAYLVSAILLIFFVINLRTRTLVKRAKELENSVNQRTAELAQEKSKVEQLLSRKNEEFANVSHEFRTPLTLILGPLAQVIKKIKTEEEINRLNIVQRNGYRLLRMVDQLLNLETFRIKSITQKSPQAIGKITQLLTDAFADLASEKQITLSVKKSTDINFEFTPDAYEKILLNLLSNAVKYSQSGDSISISTERTNNNHFKLHVADTGIGIPEDKLETVFERYHRVLDEKSEQVTGAGIGLALVKELVEAHNGSIKVDSELGQGTSISVLLPIVGEVDTVELDSHANEEIVAMELMSLTAQETNDKIAQSNEVIDDSSKHSVLVIEDNPDMRQYIVSSIGDDYQVLTANDGEAGLELAVKEVPDLIISDIMMPKMDGYQTANALRNNEITSHIPIILLTARGDRESRLKGWYERADEYLTKPFDVEELKIRLHNLLEIRDILKKRFAETAFEPTAKLSVDEKQDVEANKTAQQQAFLAHLNTCLDDIYANSELTVPDIAKVVAMSERQFFRKLKSIMDMSPVEYLRRYRLEKGKQYLIEGKSASFAAFEVGFSSQSYFGRCFKAQFGMSPKEFKNQLNKV